MCFRKTSLKNTKWTAQYNEFVADAGNETVTLILEFTSAKEFRLETVSIMPPYPAMYMNQDGTVDTMPGWQHNMVQEGHYKLSDGMLTLTTDDDTVMHMICRDGKLLYKVYDVHEVEFTKE